MKRAPCKSAIMGLLLAALALVSTSCIARDAVPFPVLFQTKARAQGIKLLVDKAGIYAVSAAELSRAGLDFQQLSVDEMRLTAAGQAVPFLISDNQLIFYGQEPGSRYTTTRAYLLESGQKGVQMAEKKVPNLASPAVDTVPQTIHLEQNLIYRADARVREDDDVWFWNELSQQQTFEMEAVIPSLSKGPFQLKVASWGMTDLPDVAGDHSFDLLVNGEPVGSVIWDGQQHHEADIMIAEGVLRAGANNITLDNRAEGAAFLDMMQINWLELIYQAPTAAAGDRLDFSGVQGMVTLTGFSQAPLIFDVSDADKPALLRGWTAGKQQLHLPVTSDMSVSAIAPDGFYRPIVQPLRESAWRSAEKQADLIIITTQQLAPHLAPLIKAREEQGLRVALVNVEDIYDTFGFGSASPESIKAFVTYAYRNWREPRPRYLFLVGDATTDFLGNVSELPANHVPSLLVPVHFGGETVSDSRLVDVDGDAQPDLAVGRWPVDTPEQVQSLVRRTLAYEQAGAARRVIFAADGSEARFQQIVQRIAGAGQFAGSELEQLSDARTEDFLRAWNEGAWLVTYIGHGSITRWGKTNIITSETVDSLKGASPPLVLQLTCLTGLFAYPEQPSLVEAMLTHDHGPVLSVAATSLTLSGHQEPFAVQLLQNLRDSNIVRIGDAFQKAKLALAADNGSDLQEISDTFLLFGDPSTPIVRPELEMGYDSSQS